MRTVSLEERRCRAIELVEGDAKRFEDRRNLRPQ